MIRSLTTTALVGACFAAATTQAAEVTFSGTVDAGTLINFDTLADAPIYSHNVEANLTTNVKFTDAVSAQLYGAAVAGEVPGLGIGGAAGRYPTYNFDGATITWKIGEDQTLMFGDIVYARGSIGYYLLKRYTAVARTQAIQGVGFSSGGLSVYAGNPDIQDDVTAFGVGYTATLAEGMTLEPFADITTGLSQNLPWTAGAQFKGAFGPLALAASGSVFGADPAVGGKTKHAIGYAIVAEPNLTFGDFSWANAVIFAPKAEAIDSGEYPEYSYPIRHGRSYAPIAEDMILYTEPGFKFSDLVSAGFAVEFKDTYMGEDKSETTSFTPNLYLYPAEGASITIYAGANTYTAEVAPGETKPATFFGGLETIFKF